MCDVGCYIYNMLEISARFLLTSLLQKEYGHHS